MKNNLINYNKIASGYDNRYSNEQNSDIVVELNNIIKTNKYEKISEIACGTGYWLQNIDDNKKLLVGLDNSIAMLNFAKIKNSDNPFICGDAENLPLKRDSLDFIYCVNSIHHFENKQEFIRSVVGLLKPNGSFAVVGVFPTDKNYKWYLYDYFSGIYEYDLNRFPTENELLDSFAEEKLIGISSKNIYTVSKTYYNSDVFKDSFLERDGCSQLAMLSDDDYELGIKSIKKQIKKMNLKGKETIFSTAIQYKIIIGKKLN